MRCELFSCELRTNGYQLTARWAVAGCGGGAFD
jgi:hypothetical protein